MSLYRMLTRIYAGAAGQNELNVARSANGNQFCAASCPAHSDLASISARMPVSSCKLPFGSSRGLSISIICRHRCASGSVDRSERVVHVSETRPSQDEREGDVGSAWRAMSGTNDAWKRKCLRIGKRRQRLERLRGTARISDTRRLTIRTTTRGDSDRLCDWTGTGVSPRSCPPRSASRVSHTTRRGRGLRPRAIQAAGRAEHP